MAGREREREKERERDLCSHVSRGSKWRRERGVLQMGSLLLLLLLPLSAPGLACSAIKHVTTTTAPTQSLFWCSSKSPDDNDDHHHPRAIQE